MSLPKGKKNKRSWECRECNETFTKGRFLTSHMEIEHDIRFNECNICNETFESNVKLTKHKHIVHGIERPVKCPHCESTFSEKKSLYTHISR